MSSEVKHILHKLSAILGLLLVCTYLTLTHAQEEVDSAVLTEVFGNEETQSTVKQDAENCECVPFYLCTNETINEYGENIIDIRLGESDCPHYLEKCCSAPADPSTVTPKPVPESHSCGIRQPEGVGFKITGNNDNEANYGEFPWMAAILKRKQVTNAEKRFMECGGSIIHPQVILTAAHCVKGKKDLGLYVRAGEWDSQTDKEFYPTQERDVKEIIIHESYYAGGLHNDVALLLLESPLELSEVVGTICLPKEKESMNNRLCVVSGWGKDVFGKEGKYQVILKRVEQPVIPKKKCQEALRETRLGARFKLHESFICAGGEIGKDSCKGDGGGPLVCPSKDNPNVYVQAGMVSWGIGCGTKTPAVYVNVPHFRAWIDNKIASLKLG